MRQTDSEFTPGAYFSKRSLLWASVGAAFGAIALFFFFGMGARSRGDATPDTNDAPEPHPPVAQAAGPKQSPGTAVTRAEPAAAAPALRVEPARAVEVEARVDARTAAAPAPMEPSAIALPEAVQAALGALGQGTPPHQI